jgi:putative PEP-CTERM system TPR-repeat lipoprotein
MGRFKSNSISGALALLTAITLVACSDDRPETLLASAKDYIAKGDNKAAVIQLKNVLQDAPNQGEARFLLGQTLLASGDASAAEVELKKAKELDYPSDQITPELARALLMLGQGKKIIDEYAQVDLGSAGSRADLKNTLGQAYLLAGKVELAKAAFDASLAAVPDYGPALIGQARIRAGQGDLPGALALLDGMLEKSPKSFEGWQLKGDIHTAQKQLENASQAYRKALEIKPDLIAAHAALINQALEANQVDVAEAQLGQMKKAAAAHPLTTYLQAQVLFRKKDFKAAQEAVQQYLKVIPDNTRALLLAGAIEYELKAYGVAETYLQKALPKTPALGLARRLLIASYLRTGQPAKALATLQPVLDKIDEDSNMLALAGEVFMQNGDAEKAARYLAKSAALDPNNTGKRTSAALSRLATGDGDKAMRELEQVASADTGIRADLALIAAHLNRRQYDQALAAIAALEKKRPDTPLVANLRGSALLAKGDAAGARRSFEQALARNPTYFPAAASLARLDLLDKKPDEAKKRFATILEKDPKNMYAQLALAQLHAQTGSPRDEVARLIEQAIAANPTEVSPRLALIEHHLGGGDAKKALSAANEALGMFPDRAEVLAEVGRAQHASADYNQALSTWGKLAAQTPNSPQPYVRMAETHIAAGNKPAALQSLRKAQAIKPDLVEAQRGIVMLELDAGRPAEALAVARQVQSQRPREAIGYLLEGDTYAVRKAWNDAANAYRNGLKQSGDGALAVKLHVALNADGKTAEADRFADGYLKDHPKDQSFRLYLAESANARKDYATASRNYRVLLEAQPNNAALLNNLAWSSARTKDPKAIEYAEKAYTLAPESAAVLDTLAELLLDKGETGRALELSQKATSLEPKNAQIRLNLAKAQVKAGKKDEARKTLDELAKLGDAFPAQAEVTKLLQSL